MVITQVVRIRNNTLRTFYVQAGDPFYTPMVDDCPCPGGIVEVPPGFDQSTDGFVVPWESLTREGLKITEQGSDEPLRCVIGPVEPFTDGRDYLQFRSGAWEPLGNDKWLNVGRRHILGTIGSSVEVQLSFRDARGSNAALEEPAKLEEVTHFEPASKCAATNTVFLNIFDLASALSIPNAMLNNTVFNTVGAFHAAVEVYGEEWSFYRTPNATSCGVCKSLRPRHHPVHVYRQSVNLGTTLLKDWEVKYLVRGKLASKWPGGEYDLLYRNCIHFCDELQLSLGVKPVPSWVRNLHEAGANLLHMPWPLSTFFSGGQSKQEELGDDLDDDSDEIESCTATNPSETGRTLTPTRFTRIYPDSPGTAGRDLAISTKNRLLSIDSVKSGRSDPEESCRSLATNGSSSERRGTM